MIARPTAEASNAVDERWERVLATLAEAGVPRLDLINIVEIPRDFDLIRPMKHRRWARSLVIRDHVEVRDTYTADDRWTGWRVNNLETGRAYGPTRRLGELARYVTEQLRVIA